MRVNKSFKSIFQKTQKKVLKYSPAEQDDIVHLTVFGCPITTSFMQSF